jgi:predicted RNase H-like HicB family nuclease
VVKKLTNKEAMQMTNSSHFVVQIKQDAETGWYTGYVADYPNRIYSEAKTLAELYETIKDILILTNGGNENIPKLVGIFL